MKRIVLFLFCVMTLSSIVLSTLVKAQFPGDDDEGTFMEEPPEDEEEQEGIEEKEPEKSPAVKPPQPETEDTVEDTEDMDLL